MHSRRKDLTNIVAFITHVILPDGADIKVTEAGILRVSAAEYVACPWSTDDSVVRYPICAVWSYYYLRRYDHPHHHA